LQQLGNVSLHKTMIEKSSVFSIDTKGRIMKERWTLAEEANVNTQHVQSINSDNQYYIKNGNKAIICSALGKIVILYPISSTEFNKFDTILLEQLILKD
jgi:hypothetical protein